MASLLLFTAVSLFSTRTIKFHTGARGDCAVIKRSSILFVTASIVTSTCEFSSNCSDLLSDGIDAHCSSLFLSTSSVCPLCLTLPSSTSKCIQCISSPPLRSIRPRCVGGYECRLLPNLSHRACLKNVTRVITTITRYRLSIV